MNAGSHNGQDDKYRSDLHESKDARSACAFSSARRTRAGVSKSVRRNGSTGFSVNGEAEFRRCTVVLRRILVCSPESFPRWHETPELRARIWICSAGYGLISPQSEISSYSATFSPYERDSVTRGFDCECQENRSAAVVAQLLRGGPVPTVPNCVVITAIARRYPRRSTVGRCISRLSPRN